MAASTEVSKDLLVKFLWVRSFMDKYKATLELVFQAHGCCC
jgi:hypothetical protein